MNEVKVELNSTQKHAGKITAGHERTNEQESGAVQDKLTITQGTKKSTIVRGDQGAKWESFSTPPPVKLHMQVQSLSELKVADHVMLTQAAEETHGIALDKQDGYNTLTAMEFTKGLRKDGRGNLYQSLTIQESKNMFDENVNVSVVIFDKGEALPDALVLSNLTSVDAELNYYILGRSCESVTRWCKTGQFELKPGKSSFKTVLRCL